MALFSQFLSFFLKLQPLKYPGFAFSWLELISNRYFMPVILNCNKMEINLEFHYLISALMKFFKEITNEQSICKQSYKDLYKGTLRVLLVLLHDFPEFLCEFSFSFCDYIPEKFTQVRNIVLAALPKNLKPPNPYSVNQMDKIDDFKVLP